jgi:alpha-D-xyloside xylohydrolase
MNRIARVAILASLSASAAAPTWAQWTPMNPVTSVERQADGIVLTLKTGVLRLQVCSNSIVRVRYALASSFPDNPDPIAVKTSWPAPKWSLEESGSLVTMTTERLKVVVDRRDASITYRDAQGRQLVQEASRKLIPAAVNGEDTHRAESFFNVYGSREGLYGLGQQQAGVWNHRGNSVDLSHDNSHIAVPFLVSSNGYGILWNNASRSRFNNRFANYLYLTSEVADVIDYYFIFGPDLDRVVAGYRELTGDAPLFGKWAYGFWQCKNRYRSQAELLGVAKKYRELKIPVDNIVQDWFWWNRKGEHVFNSNYPDPKGMVDELHRSNFHLMISVWPFFEPGSAEYSEMERRGWFIDTFKYAKPPYHADRMAVYDATNPEARKYYWGLMDNGLFKLGVDAWWLDTTEPETEGQEDNIQLGHKLAIGSGNRYVNLYSLFTTSAVYEGQRSASTDKRVFILSRSAFAGAQRNAVTAWSGDIGSDWFSFRRQIPAGLNFSLSGLPYWTTDIGGFLFGSSPADPAYRELFTRWFQYGTFCPIFRVHGTRNPDENELWSYGPETQKILMAYDRLRYRLLPYIYSMAWMTTHERYTPMRPLVMDFRTDVRAADIGDQFMYGPAFLVNPVGEPGATTRHLYLPRSTWIDFWTGSEKAGGLAIDAPAPIDRMPLFVRAGSIVPLGPDLEWASQKPADPLELRVYRGADGAFTLYEDEGDTYNYEKGQFATIPFAWNDATQTLTVGERKGAFPGMLEERTFHVVFVGANHGAGIDAQAKPDRVVKYAGTTMTIRAEGRK